MTHTCIYFRCMFTIAGIFCLTKIQDSKIVLRMATSFNHTIFGPVGPHYEFIFSQDVMV